MPLFKYSAFDKQGKSVSGTIEASSSSAAKERVRSQGLMPIDVKETTTLEEGSFTLRSLFERPVDPKSIILFTKQLGVLLKAGVPLLQAVELLSNQFEGKLKRILINIKDEIKAGKAFAFSLEKYPRVFSRVYIQLVRAGEASGKLENILINLSDYLEKVGEIKRRVKKAMSYPIMMISLSVIVVGVLVTFAVPKVVGIFTQTGMPIPGPTQFVMDLSDFVISNYFVLILGLFAFVTAFRYWKRTPYGKLTLDKFSLRLPLFSYFVRTKVVVDFSKTLGMLLDSGVNLAEALDIVCNIIDNSVLTRSLKSARDKIIKEGKIAKYLRETNIFPPIASYMINTGEQSGKLSEMLLTIGRDYEVELFDLIDGLVAKINPLMMLVVGGLIFFIIIAMFLPMLEMGEMFEKMGTF